MGNWQFNRFSRLAATQQVQQLSITESTTDLVATIDIDGFIIWLNTAGHTMLGLDPGSDLSRLRLAGFYAKADAAKFVNREVPNAIVMGASLSEVMLEPAGGEKIPSSHVLIAHKDHLGNIEYFSVILRDISAIKAAEKERRELSEQLHQARKVETIGRLAGGLAHDFNNYMTVIVGHSELGLLSSVSDAEARAQLEIILDTARKASQLSSQLLDISSKQIIDPQPLDLNDICRQLRKLVSSLMSEGITVDYQMSAQAWLILFDRSQLERILLNLALNSRDAMDNRGVFRIKTENLNLAEDESRAIGLDGAGDYVRLEISDTGCGVEKSNLNHIFEPFFTTKQKGHGTGLGLSAVYGAIKQNNSHIRAFSTVGVGTRFEIYFPRDNSMTAVREIEVDGSDITRSETGAERILLVEDDPAVRNLLLKILRDLDYEVLEAADGAKALEIFQQRSREISLVVSDVTMPNMNGMELLRELHKLNSPTKVLLMSGHTDLLLSHEELDRWNVKVLHKPFSMRKFTNAVKQELETNRAI